MPIILFKHRLKVFPPLIPGLMQPIIKPFLTDQLRMGATLDDAAVVENQDAVCSPHC